MVQLRKIFVCIIFIDFFVYRHNLTIPQDLFLMGFFFGGGGVNGSNINACMLNYGIMIVKHVTIRNKSFKYLIFLGAFAARSVSIFPCLPACLCVTT